MWSDYILKTLKGRYNIVNFGKIACTIILSNFEAAYIMCR